MELPPLQKEIRNREFKQHSDEEREAVVYAYLFQGKSYRYLDDCILKLNSKKTRGYESMGILHHYGLKDPFKGIFKDKAPLRVIQDIKIGSDYDFISSLITSHLNRIRNEGPPPIIEGEFNIDYKANLFLYKNPIIGKESDYVVKQRMNQYLFRETILRSYNGKCCITGINIPQLLRASHIKPWSKSDSHEKLDPHNGLCLNTLHDSAFDAGLLTVNANDYTIELSSQIKETVPSETYKQFFYCYEGVPIAGSEYEPDLKYLRYHNKSIFKK